MGHFATSTVLAVAALSLLDYCKYTQASQVGFDWKKSALEKLDNIEMELNQEEQSYLKLKKRTEKVRAAELRASCAMVRRAAFDIGSGATKIQVADVDFHSALIPQTKTVVYSDKVNILLTEDLERSSDSSFSASVLQELERVLREFKARAQKAGAEQFAGVATAAFRVARNGGDFLRRMEAELGLRIRVISQEQEGVLGFLTASWAAPELGELELVAWDSGGGSFQISGMMADGVGSWLAAVGCSVAKVMLVEKVQGWSFKQHPSPNPVSVPQVQADGVRVVGIGGDTSIFCLASQLTESNPFTRAKVLESIENMCEKTDLQLKHLEDCPAAQAQPQGVVPKLVLLFAIMDVLQLDSVAFRPVFGNAAGIMSTQALWD